MARLDQLTDNFMQSFLRNNPKSLVDSNGYWRSEYEAELTRRGVTFNAYVRPAEVPDPTTFANRYVAPQFQCVGNDIGDNGVVLPALDTPEEQLGLEEAKRVWLDTPLFPLSGPAAVQ